MHLRSSDSDQHSLHPPSNERLFLPTTAFNRFAVTREIDEASGERIGSQPGRFCLDGARGRLNARGLCIHKGVMATTGACCRLAGIQVRLLGHLPVVSALRCA